MCLIPEYREATAKTLEYAYDDFCGYQLAKLTGNTFYKNIFARQMYNYRNVYDSVTGFMRGTKVQWCVDAKFRSRSNGAGLLPKAMRGIGNGRYFMICRD